MFQLWLANVMAWFALRIDLGELQQLYTVVLQVFLIIAIILFVAAILVIFFPGLRKLLPIM